MKFTIFGKRPFFLSFSSLYVYILLPSLFSLCNQAGVDRIFFCSLDRDSCIFFSASKSGNRFQQFVRR